MEDESWNGMENNTYHNSFLELDEHQAPTTHPPRLQVQNESSSSSHNDSSSRSDSDSDHTHQKMKSLSDIYDQDVVQFEFFSSQPTCFDEATKQKEWVDAMNNEIEAIERNNTWDLVDLLVDRNVVGVKWVYKTKLNEKGDIDKHKARLVARCFSQQHGIVYGETFAPVARLDTVHFV